MPRRDIEGRSTLVSPCHPEFRGCDCVTQPQAERAAKYGLRAAETIHICDVEQIDAQIDRTAYRRDAGDVVDWTVVVAADRRAAETDARHTEVRPAQRNIFHIRLGQAAWRPGPCGLRVRRDTLINGFSCRCVIDQQRG